MNLGIFMHTFGANITQGRNKDPGQLNKENE